MPPCKRRTARASTPIRRGSSGAGRGPVRINVPSRGLLLHVRYVRRFGSLVGRARSRSNGKEMTCATLQLLQAQRPPSSNACITCASLRSTAIRRSGITTIAKTTSPDCHPEYFANPMARHGCALSTCTGIVSSHDGSAPWHSFLRRHHPQVSARRPDSS